jgi:hypothetical protein
LGNTEKKSACLALSRGAHLNNGNKKNFWAEILKYEIKSFSGSLWQFVYTWLVLNRREELSGIALISLLCRVPWKIIFSRRQVRKVERERVENRGFLCVCVWERESERESLVQPRLPVAVHAPFVLPRQYLWHQPLISCLHLIIEQKTNSYFKQSTLL